MPNRHLAPVDEGERRRRSRALGTLEPAAAYTVLSVGPSNPARMVSAAPVSRIVEDRGVRSPAPVRSSGCRSDRVGEPVPTRRPSRLPGRTPPTMIVVTTHLGVVAKPGSRGQRAARPGVVRPPRRRPSPSRSGAVSSSTVDPPTSRGPFWPRGPADQSERVAEVDGDRDCVRSASRRPCWAAGRQPAHGTVRARRRRRECARAGPEAPATAAAMAAPAMPTRRGGDGRPGGDHGVGVRRRRRRAPRHPPCRAAGRAARPRTCRCSSHASFDRRPVGFAGWRVRVRRPTSPTRRRC